jgi:hypothetical protein
MEKQIVSNEYLELKVDVQKNRIYGTYLGFWSQNSIMDDLFTNLQKAIDMVKKNYTFVADLRNFSVLPQALVPRQVEAMKMMNSQGLYRVAEILPQSIVAGMQLKQNANKTNMPNKQFSSIPEGEKWLDEETKKL